MPAPETPPRAFAVVVTIEGLGCNLVGCYGGSLAPTKAWDSMASRSVVFDQFWADTLESIDVLESMWTGRHFALRNPYEESMKNNSLLLSRAMLVTDSVSIVEGMALDCFGDVLLFESDSEDCGESELDLETSENERGQTQFERLLETALGRWATQHEEFPILWIHSQGLSGLWDAPYAFRAVMCDEGDPDPPQGIEPFELQLTPDTDPDEVFGMACAMGGQAIVMDEAWMMIENALGELGIANDCMRILAGVRGYPLGEHGWVGNGGNSLYAESIHLPLIICPGDRLTLGIRVPFMVQPDSIFDTLMGWINATETTIGTSRDLMQETAAISPDQWPIANQIAFSVFADQVHLAVPAWSCRWSTASQVSDSEQEVGTQKIELFAMPDDRWQQNEISQRAAGVVEQMAVERDRWASRYSCGLEEAERLVSDLTHPTR